MRERLKELLLTAIEYPCPPLVFRGSFRVWNQPFLYEIDRARAVVISYNPSGKRALAQDPEGVRRFRALGGLDREEIFERLYRAPKEGEEWAQCRSLFEGLLSDGDAVARLNASFFAYRSSDYFRVLSPTDGAREFLYRILSLLGEELEYIFVNGAENRRILPVLTEGYALAATATLSLPAGKTGELSVYRQKSGGRTLVYYGRLLFGNRKAVDGEELALVKSKMRELLGEA